MDFLGFIIKLQTEKRKRKDSYLLNILTDCC